MMRYHLHGHPMPIQFLPDSNINKSVVSNTVPPKQIKSTFYVEIYKPQKDSH